LVATIFHRTDSQTSTDTWKKASQEGEKVQNKQKELGDTGKSKLQRGF
jgi:hypothetical protein